MRVDGTQAHSTYLEFVACVQQDSGHDKARVERTLANIVVFFARA